MNGQIQGSFVRKGGINRSIQVPKPNLNPPLQVQSIEEKLRYLFIEKFQNFDNTGYKFYMPRGNYKDFDSIDLDKRIELLKEFYKTYVPPVFNTFWGKNKYNSSDLEGFDFNIKNRGKFWQAVFTPHKEYIIFTQNDSYEGGGSVIFPCNNFLQAAELIILWGSYDEQFPVYASFKRDVQILNF